MPANQKAEANKDGAPSGLAVGAGFGLSALECRTASDPTMAYVRRREWLSRRENVPSCVFCGEREQMQLTDHIWSELARWKCRTCGHRFFSEPNTDSADARRAQSKPFTKIKIMNVEKLTENPQGKSVGSSSSGSALLSALSFVCECRKIEPEKLTLNEREMVALADERDRLRALLCDAVGALDSRLLAAWGSDLEERICRELEPNDEVSRAHSNTKKDGA